MASTLQGWVMDLSMQMQGVLISAVRGPDGFDNFGPHKMLGRHYRRSIMNSAVEQRPIEYGNMTEGGKFMAPVVAKFSSSEENYKERVRLIMTHFDPNMYPRHFVLHMTHAAEIVGYFHPDHNYQSDWAFFYELMCKDSHMRKEPKGDLLRRLGDLQEPEKDQHSKETFTGTNR